MVIKNSRHASEAMSKVELAVARKAIIDSLIKGEGQLEVDDSVCDLRFFERCAEGMVNTITRNHEMSTKTTKQQITENAIREFMCGCSFLEGALDTELTPTYSEKENKAKIAFPSAVDEGGYYADMLEFNTIGAAAQFVSDVALMIRIGRLQRTGR